jgi:carbon storage regulator CsrA
MAGAAHVVEGKRAGRAAPAGATGLGEEEAGMLVLDRKVHEGFWIEGRIYVKVLAVGRRRVKLGVQAPSDYRVVREELAPSAEGLAGRKRHASPAGEDGSEGSLRSLRRRS